MTHRIMILSATLATMSIFCIAVTSAQITETKLIASDGEPGDFFGSAVSISGNYALIGAPQVFDHDYGSAYVFRYDGSNWTEQAKLAPSDGYEGDYFGWRVSISGDYALIGAPGTNGAGVTGSAYVFRYNGSSWVEQTKLIASDSAPNDQFGSSVQLSGDHAIVGAYGDDDNGFYAGSAYIFRYNGSSWVQQAKLIASDGSANDEFGSSVSLSGDYALIGARYDGGGAGSAYIFHREASGWAQQTKLLASDRGPMDLFGWSVSLGPGYAVIGAPSIYSDLGGDKGSGYVFRQDGSAWVEQVKFRPDDVDVNEYFGRSVSLSGNYALVGASGDDDNLGSAYIFYHNGTSWEEQVRIVASERTSHDFFGNFVALSGDYALVGASADGGNGLNSGIVYVYTATPLCSKVSQFQARCRPGGLIKARVTMEDASHEGDIIEISIDDVPYEVTIDASGRGQLSQAGFSPGPHTVELTNPGQCFDPIVVTCRTSLDEEASDDWDDELVSETPVETALLGNYPNPFNPSTTIRYTLSVDSPVSIRVYNMLGQEVATLVDGFKKAGEQSVTWRGTNNFGQAVASGLYIYRLQAGSTVMSQKMLFAK